MQRVSFEKAGCPIARGLERIGEWWSMLIMRDALNGLTRFDEFQKNLGIAPNMLTRRLKSLVEAGLLERRGNPRDRRVRMLYLTEAAVPLLAQVDAFAASRNRMRVAIHLEVGYAQLQHFRNWATK